MILKLILIGSVMFLVIRRRSFLLTILLCTYGLECVSSYQEVHNLTLVPPQVILSAYGYVPTLHAHDDLIELMVIICCEVTSRGELASINI